MPRQTPPVPPAPRPRRQVAPLELLVVLGVAVLGGITMLWNIGASPDTQYDEVVYTAAAQQVAQDWRLTWTNEPMFVHPPLSFLAQAGWLRILGLGHAPLQDAIVAARVLTGGVMVFASLLLGLLAAHLASQAGRRRGLVLVAVVGALAVTDPVLLRYGRLAMIEPLALIAVMGTLCLAIWLRGRRMLIYVPVVGLATGLTLLTKEITAFLVFTPVVYHLLGRDWRRAGTALAGFVWGLGLWMLFPLWASALGLAESFVNMKFSMLERLTGMLQTTGWNRPGVSFFDAIRDHAGQYGTTYVVLAGGALALVWLMTRSVSGASRWLLAWLITTYGLAAYTVVLGTLNEQFFVLFMPAAIVSVVLMGDAMVARLLTALRSPRDTPALAARGALAAVVVAIIAVFAFSLTSWARYYTTDNRGMFKTVAYLQAEQPPCSVITTTDTPDKFAHLMPGWQVGAFATGPGAISHGVHLFVTSDKDVADGNAIVGAEFLPWVRSHGTRMAAFESATYNGLQLWQVPSDPYDPLADNETTPDGYFVITVGSRCGGFAVLDRPGATFASDWEAMGGKGVVGPPMTSSFDANGATVQVFAGAVLTGQGPMPIVPALAATHPDTYQAAQLPPITGTADAGLTDEDVLTRLTDPVIAAGYLGGPVGSSQDAVDDARQRYGDPVGPPTRMPDGTTRQAFAAGVLEHPASSNTVRTAPIGRMAIDVGLVSPPGTALSPVAPPPLPVDPDLGPPQPTTVRPFVVSLLLGLALYIGLPVVAYELLGHRRRRAPGRRGRPS